MLGRFSSRTRNPNSIDINQRPYSPSPPKPAIIKINQKPKVINKLLYRKIIEYLTISGILVIIKEKLGKCRAATVKQSRQRPTSQDTMTDS